MTIRKRPLICPNCSGLNCDECVYQSEEGKCEVVKLDIKNPSATVYIDK